MRKIFVTAKPNSKHPSVKVMSPSHFVISVAEPPKDNKANKAIIKALAAHLGVPQSYIEIVHGYFSKNKIIEVVD